MKTKAAFLVVAMYLFTGCEPIGYRTDLTPPSAPRGIYTLTGDNLVELRWWDNTERDLAGYRIYVSSSYNGTYQLIGSTQQNRFVDYVVRNGFTYYYAVSSYDFSGNESALSNDVVYDTPRPEGYNVALRDYRTRSDLAGYDFSTYSVGPYDDQYSDVFFENYFGTYYMNVWDDTDIRDMGYTNSLYDIGYAPEDGWSLSKDARLFVGHTYVVWTWDNHYAKFRVTSISPDRVIFDWAYQLQEGNPRLKSSVQNGRKMELGSGARERRERHAVD